jgi:hypothetical protein
MRGLLEKGNFLAIMSQMAKEAQRGAFALTEGGLAACRGMDLVLAATVFEGVLARLNGQRGQFQGMWKRQAVRSRF